MAIKRYLDVRFDVTDLSEDEAGALCGEVTVQAEVSDDHPSVEVEIEWNEVEIDDEERAALQRALNRADALFRAYSAADDTARSNGADGRDELILSELTRSLRDQPSGITANVLLEGEASETLANAIRDELARDGAGITVQAVAGTPMFWFDPYLAVYDPKDPDDEPLFLMYGGASGGTFLAPDARDVDEVERRLVRCFGDSGWTIDDHGELAR